uniref:Uncharacterized protein n=1 Tax=Solanum tuberosum TaxID=4113 RepID=M1DU26_SOLTU
MLESSEDHRCHHGQWSSLRTMAQSIVLVPVGSIEDPNYGKSKGRPRRVSRTVKTLTGRGRFERGIHHRIYREKNEEQRLTLSLRFWDSDYSHRLEVVHFDLEIIKWLLIYQLFLTRSKGPPLIPYDSELEKSLRKMVNAQELEAQRQRLGLEAEAAIRGFQ